MNLKISRLPFGPRRKAIRAVRSSGSFTTWSSSWALCFREDPALGSRKMVMCCTVSLLPENVSQINDDGTGSQTFLWTRTHNHVYQPEVLEVGFKRKSRASESCVPLLPSSQCLLRWFPDYTTCLVDFTAHKSVYPLVAVYVLALCFDHIT